MLPQNIVTTIDALDDEIRVLADPDWSADKVDLTLWLIREGDPIDLVWDRWTRDWNSLIDQSGRYRSVEMRIVTFADMTAKDYRDSHRLELDHLSISSSV